MLTLLVVIWFLSGLLGLHIAYKVDGPLYPSDIWLALAGVIVLVVVLIACVEIAVDGSKSCR